MSTSNSQRIISLDYFRGLTICFMIIVSMPGNYPTTFAPLLHAQWHGFTPTDLVFPSFLFASGNALAITLAKNNLNRQQQIIKAFKRALIIFLLGILLYWFPFFSYENSVFKWRPISEIRIMGVLQRIALCYFIVTILALYLSRKLLLIFALLLLPAYWLLLYILPHGAEVLGIHDNAVTMLDLKILGDKHIYHGEGFAFDPEGILSTLPALFNTIAGFLVAKYLREKKVSANTVLNILHIGIAMVAVSYFWNYSFPINKKLWTSSFALHTTGLDIIILSAIVFIVDIRKRNWLVNFFQPFGKNPLFVYLAFETTGTIMYMIKTTDNHTLYHWIYRHIFSYATGYIGSFLFAFTFMILFWLLASWMDKRKIYVRI